MTADDTKNCIHGCIRRECLQCNPQDLPKRYEVRLSGGWAGCRVAEKLKDGDGWLQYQLYDGTVGLSRPGDWRIKANVYRAKANVYDRSRG